MFCKTQANSVFSRTLEFDGYLKKKEEEENTSQFLRANFVDLSCVIYEGIILLFFKFNFRSLFPQKIRFFKINFCSFFFFF